MIECALQHYNLKVNPNDDDDNNNNLQFSENNKIKI